MTPHMKIFLIVHFAEQNVKEYFSFVTIVHNSHNVASFNMYWKSQWTTKRRLKII